MKKTKLVASCLAVGIFAISASVQASSRVTRVNAVPLGERVAPIDTTRAAGGNVFANLVPGGFFFPQAPDDLETQLLQGVSEDIGLAPGNARELISYACLIHQRASEGPLGFTVHLSLQEDDGSGVESLPVSGLNFIEGTQCSIPDIHGLGRPDEAFAQCVPESVAGSSGIIVDDKVWMKFVIEGGCIGANTDNLDDCIIGADSIGPGMLLTDGSPASVGFTENTFALSLGDLQQLTGFADGNGLPAQMNAGVAAPIPTVSEWGMVLIAMLVLTGGTIVLRRTRRSVATA